MLETISLLRRGSTTPIELNIYDHSSGYYIEDASGLGPVEREVSTTPYALFSGSKVVNSKRRERNIVLQIGITTDSLTGSVHAKREFLYSHLSSSSWVTLTFIRSGKPNITITGWVETVEPTIFSLKPSVTVSIICPDPNFKHVYYRSRTFSAYGSTTLDFTYTGSEPVGIHLVADWKSGSTGRYTSLTVTNTFNSGQNTEQVTITTDPTSLYRLVYNSQERERSLLTSDTSYDPPVVNFKALAYGSSWIRLYPGENTLDFNPSGVNVTSCRYDYRVTYTPLEAYV